MNLGELIERLKQEHNKSRIIKDGFTTAHSYRGDYECIAFAPTPNVAIGEMLGLARIAVGTTFQGYKGGDFQMGVYTNCYLANNGETGDELSATLLDYMLADSSQYLELNILKKKTKGSNGRLYRRCEDTVS